MSAHTQHFAAAFTPAALRSNLPLRLMRDGLSAGLACSLRCAGELLDAATKREGEGTAIELANPFETHDYYCGHCGTRIS